MLKLETAVERLLSGERADRFTFKREPYGYALRLSAFGWRLLVDVMPSRPTSAPPKAPD